MDTVPTATAGFARVRDCFHLLLELPADARAAALQRYRDASPALADELQSLLNAMNPADLDAPSPALVSAERIPGYQLRRRIGSGGMGEVWEAERTTGTTRQRVAIKLLHGSRSVDEIRARFLREHRILAKLTHAHIAAFIDAGISDSGRAWLAMEFVEGEGLSAWCRAHESIEERLRLFLQICAAVHFAHLHLVVHRDIKPANVMVSPLAGAKLLDFGIAKLLDDSEADLTQTGLQAMTARYAAPEQVGGGLISVGTDVYSLGVLLFEMLTVRSPYARAESGEQSYATSVVNEDMRALGPLLVDKPARRRVQELELILRRALAKPSTERYSSVAAMADDLQDWLAQVPMRSGIGGGRARLRHLLRLYRWPLLATASVMLTIVVGGLLAWQQARRAEHERARAEQHLAALLDVVGSANSGVYAGRDPLASDLLITAAARLQRDAAGDPQLLRNALSEIGHGLLNLGKREAAEQVLSAAVAAMDREPEANPARALGLLKLLALSQDTIDVGERLRATAARIERLARVADNSGGLAIDALASAAGSLSRIGAFDEAERLLVVADELWRRHPQATASERENFLRQRGWVAMRAADFPTAYRAFTDSLHVMDTAPADFAPLRRAEGEWLQTEAALGFDPTLAAAPIRAARPVVLAHYPEGHVERAQWQVLEAQAALFEGRHGDAVQLLDSAEPVLRVAEDAALAREMIVVLRAWAEVLQGRCENAQAWLARAIAAAPSIGPPRSHYWIERLGIVYAEHCASAG